MLIDQNERVGGWCRSIEDRGFTFDYAGHIMFSNDPYVHQLYKMLLGDNIHWQNREAWIYSKNVYTRYPFQGALYGLPPTTIKECIVGAIEARFGSLKTKADDHAKKLNGGVGGSLTGTAAMNNVNGHSNGNGHAMASRNAIGHANPASTQATAMATSKTAAATGSRSRQLNSWISPRSLPPRITPMSRRISKSLFTKSGAGASANILRFPTTARSGRWI